LSLWKAKIFAVMSLKSFDLMLGGVLCQKTAKKFRSRREIEQYFYSQYRLFRRKADYEFWRRISDVVDEMVA